MRVVDGILYDVYEEDLKLLEEDPDTFWEGITAIGTYAFCSCPDLKSIRIPGSIKTIYTDAFSQTNVVEVEIEEGVEDLWNGVFCECEKLKTIHLPSTLKSIGWFAFKGCRSLTEIEIPDLVTRINPFTFQDCRNLTKAKLSNSTETIEYGAFELTGLTEIDIPKSVIDIEVSAFAGSKLVHVDIPESVEWIGRSAFDCGKLRTVTIFKNEDFDCDPCAFNPKTEIIYECEDQSSDDDEDQPGSPKKA